MTARLYIQWHVCLDERDPWLSYVIYHTTVWSRLASATTPSVALDLPPLDGHLDSSDRKPELDSNTHVEFVRLSLCYFCFAERSVRCSVSACGTVLPYALCEVECGAVNRRYFNTLIEYFKVV